MERYVATISPDRHVSSQSHDVGYQWILELKEENPSGADKWCWISRISPESGIYPESENFFFSSCLADVALRLGPYISISSQKDICTRTQEVHQSWQIKINQKNTRPTTTTTRKSPSQICVSSRENSKPDKKNGARPKQTNNHNKDLPKDTADLPLCHSTKACKMNYPPRHSVKHEDRSKNEWLRYQEWKTVHWAYLDRLS